VLLNLRGSLAFRDDSHAAGGRARRSQRNLSGGRQFRYALWRSSARPWPSRNTGPRRDAGTPYPRFPAVWDITI
jgi:hypothetical protein